MKTTANTSPTAKPLHIFKPGRHVAMSGQAFEFSEADLAATAKAYDPKLHKAPLVKGHPKHDEPAQGWAKSLAANARGLFALPTQVNPEFAESVNTGSYGTISAKFYAPDSLHNPVPGVWYLRHIGFLGAQPPAVKGMDEPSFSEVPEEDGCVSFCEVLDTSGLDASVEFGERWHSPALLHVASVFRRVREWIIEKDGVDTADRLMPGWEIESIKELADRTDNSADAPTTFSESAANPTALINEPTSSVKENTVTLEEKARIEAENQRLKDENAALKNAQAVAAQKARHDANVAFAEQLITDRRIEPKDRDLVIATLDHASVHVGDSAPEFGEGDDKQPLADALKAYYSKLPQGAEFAEMATAAKAKTVSTANPLVADAEARAATAK